MALLNTVEGNNLDALLCEVPLKNEIFCNYNKEMRLIQSTTVEMGFADWLLLLLLYH